ncbi:MAG TPA: DegT/DnrJ/EryC1/StrS family aminotransferase [Actinomycetes bacterium]|nr:DegT/DnrJ/EryC1/StrS family aminotransferase [Actinomycetes bacterium]
MRRVTRSVEQLALFGGTPAFSSVLHVGRPNVGDRTRLLDRIGDILDSRWLSNNGPYVREFEQRVADLAGVRHCVSTCNATMGIQLLVQALGLTGEVILPSLTFVASAHALAWQGLTPVFCDVDPVTHNLDPARVQELITPRTSAIMGVHLWGRPCDVDALDAVARRHGLVLIFDAAHAFACSHRGRMIGGFGRAEVFSFHATKFVNSFEGGAVVTDDDGLAERIRLTTNFGLSGPDEVALLGTNAKLSEAAAAMGLTSLDSLDEFVAVNRDNWHAYRAALRGVPGVHLAAFDPGERNNYQYVVVEVDEDRAGVSRDQLQAVLLAENVMARRYFHPGCHRLEPYRSRDPHAGDRLPQTRRLAGRLLVLPSGTAIGRTEIRVIGEIIRLVVGSVPTVRRRLGSVVRGAVAGG